MRLKPVVNVTKLFFFFINKEDTNRLKCFVLIETCQPSLTFAMKAGEQGTPRQGRLLTLHATIRSDRGACTIKLFMTIIYRVFVLGKPNQPSLMFVGEAMSLPQIGGPERCFTRVGTGLTCKHQTRLVRLAKDKHQLFTKIRKLRPQKFYSTGPGNA